MSAFKVESVLILMNEPIQSSESTEWLALKNIGANLIGNSIDLTHRSKRDMPRAMILIKVFSSINDSISLRGWTYFYYFKDEVEQKGNWILPLYLSPISKVINEEISKPIWDFAFAYITIGKDHEKTILSDYMESPQHKYVQKRLRFYDDWMKEAQKKKHNISEKVGLLRDDLKQVKDFLEDEQNLIDRLKNREIKMTEKVVKELGKALDKKKEKALKPINKRIEELNELLRQARDNDEREFDELTCNKKIGVKVTINWLEDVKVHEAAKIHMSVVTEDSVMIDDLQNRANYNTQRIEDFVNNPDTLEKMGKGEKFDVEIDELFFVLKNIEFYLKRFGKTKRVFLVFKAYDAFGDPFFDNEENNKRFLDSYIIKEKLIPLGVCFFELKYKDMSLNTGRYKRNLYRTIGDKFPPYIPEDKKEAIIDFTIETFEYTGENMDNFVLRFKKRKKKKEKDELFVDKRPFIPNNARQYTEKTFEKGSGIDFYIDCARYLPNSTTFTKVVLRIVDSNLKDVMVPSSKLSEFDCSMYDPIYNFKKELRFPYYDSTLMAMIQILSVNDKDIDELTPQLIGIAFFPLFLSKQTRAQPEDYQEKEFMLFDGKYQIPLFCQEYYQQRPFLYKNQ